MVQLLIADDHAVLRQGLKSLLEGIEDWKVIGEAADGLEAVKLTEKLSPDVIIVDLSMPNLGGVEAIARLKREKGNPAIVVLSAKEDEWSVQDAMKAGASAYVSKSSSSEELQFAIKAVLKGQTYLSPSVCGAFLRSEGGSPVQELSGREREVLKMIAEGKPNRDIAKLLHISPRTVDSHRANILKKLGVNSNAELTQMALKYGIIG
jgi:DNA-binding NarL/FixJ family response regulator